MMQPGFKLDFVHFGALLTELEQFFFGFTLLEYQEPFKFLTSIPHFNSLVVKTL